MTQYPKEIVIKGITFESRIKRIGKQCNQGYPCKFAISTRKKIIELFFSQRLCNVCIFEEILHVHGEIHVQLGIR